MPANNTDAVAATHTSAELVAALRESHALLRTLLELHDESDFDQITSQVEVLVGKLDKMLAGPTS